MVQRTEYTLMGYFIATNWYNQHGWKVLRIITDEDGLNKIIEDPLQDYINYGFQSVDYVYFDVYKTEIEDSEETTKAIFFKKPIKTIEAGENPLTEKEQKHFDEHFEEEFYDSSTVYYKAKNNSDS
jgi:hypothetical protein